LCYFEHYIDGFMLQCMAHTGSKGKNNLELKVLSAAICQVFSAKSSPFFYSATICLLLYKQKTRISRLCYFENYIGWFHAMVWFANICFLSLMIKFQDCSLCSSF